MKGSIVKLVFRFCISVSLSSVTASLHAQQSNRTYTLEAGLTAADYLPGKMMVRIREPYRNQCAENGIQVPDLQTAFSAIGVTAITKAFPGKESEPYKTDYMGREFVDLSLIYTLEFSPALNIETAVNQVLASQAVEYAEPWFVYQPFYSPNDQYVIDQDYLTVIRAFDAWDIEQGDSTVVVGILDTGTSFTHPDFQGKFQLNYNDPIDGIDNDNDGYKDNYCGWDFGGASFSSGADNNPTYMGPGPGRDHGVLVTGPIAAASNNSTGMVSLGFNTKFLPLKTCLDGSVGISWGYQAIVYGADHGLPIMNLSWGGNGYSGFAYDAVRYATVNKGCMLVAAAGNTHNQAVYYPASFPEVMSVAASTSWDALWYVGGSTGTTYNSHVDITAPGRNIFTTAQYTSYWWAASGTSMAAPVVCGVAALVKSHFPGYTMEQVKQRVRVTADESIYASNPNPIYAGKLGKGRVNALKALTSVTPSLRLKRMISTDNHDGIITFGDTVSLYPTLYNHLDPSQQLRLVLEASATGDYILLDSVITIGQVQTGDSVNAPQPFRIIIKSHVQTPRSFALKMRYEDAAMGYYDFEYSAITNNPTVIDVVQNSMNLTFSNNGLVGFYRNQPSMGGLGTRFAGNASMTTYGNFSIGNGGAVSDVGWNDAYGVDADFYPTKRFTRETDATSGMQHVTIFFDDQSADQPLGLSVEEHVYASTESGKENYILIDYIVKNESSDTLGDVFAGLNSIWQMGGATGTPGFDSLAALSWFSSGTGRWGGVALLSDGNFLGAHQDFYMPQLDDTYKYNRMTQNPSQTNQIAGKSDQVVSSRLGLVLPGETVRIAFAVLGGNNLQDLYNGSVTARQYYRCVLNPAIPFNGIGNDLVACDGDTLQIQATAGYSQYQWSGGNPNPQIDITTSGMYSLGVTDAFGCTFADSVNVTFHSLPSLNMPPSLNACGPITLNAASPDFCLWNTGETSAMIMATQSGTYTLQALNTNGCAAFDTTIVVISPIDAVFSGPASTLMLGQQAIFSDQSAGVATWSWNFGDGGLSQAGPNVNHQYQGPGLYTVNLEVSNGICSSNASLVIEVMAPTGIDEIVTTHQIVVYPTENEGSFNIHAGMGAGGNSVVHVISNEGKEVWTEEVVLSPSNDPKISLPSSLAQGMYMVRIENSKISEVSKILLHHN